MPFNRALMVLNNGCLGYHKGNLGGGGLGRLCELRRGFMDWGSYPQGPKDQLTRYLGLQ